MGWKQFGKYDLLAVLFGRGLCALGQFAHCGGRASYEEELHHILSDGAPDSYACQQRCNYCPREQGERKQSRVQSSVPLNLLWIICF